MSNILTTRGIYSGTAYPIQLDGANGNVKVSVQNTVAVSGSVSVSNFPTSFQVSNFPTSFQVSNFPASQVVTLASTTITGTATVSGTVTANAGTNLNTSALALETGGNLATIA